MKVDKKIIEETITLGYAINEGVIVGGSVFNFYYDYASFYMLNNHKDAYVNIENGQIYTLENKTLKEIVIPYNAEVTLKKK